MVCGISKELTTEHYHNARSIADRCTVISRKWAELQNKLDDLRETLSLYHDLMSVFSEMEDCLTDMGHIEVRGLDHVTFALCMGPSLTSHNFSLERPISTVGMFSSS